MDVVAVVGGDRSLPRPAQLPLHSVLSETLRLAAAERLRLPQLPEGKHTRLKLIRENWKLIFVLSVSRWHQPHWLIDWSLLIFLPALLSCIFPSFTVISWLIFLFCPVQTCLRANHFFLQICENYGPNLDTCPEGTVLGLLVDANSCLHLYVNGMDQGAAAQDIPSPCFPFIDLYGQCEQVSATDTYVLHHSHFVLFHSGFLMCHESTLFPYNKILLFFSITMSIL